MHLNDTIIKTQDHLYYLLHYSHSLLEYVEKRFVCVCACVCVCVCVCVGGRVAVHMS